MSAAPASSTARTSPASSAGSDPGPQRQVDVGQPGGLGRPGVGHDDRAAPGPQAAQRHEGVGPGHAWPWDTTGFWPTTRSSRAASQSTCGEEERRAGDQVGHQRLVGGVDRHRRVQLAGRQRPEEPVGHRPAGGVEGPVRRPVGADRPGAVPVDDLRQLGRASPSNVCSHNGSASRAGSWWTSGRARPLGQVYPSETGWSGSPVTRTTRSPSTWTTMPHMALHIRQKDRNSRVTQFLVGKFRLEKPG